MSLGIQRDCQGLQRLETLVKGVKRTVKPRLHVHDLTISVVGAASGHQSGDLVSHKTDLASRGKDASVLGAAQRRCLEAGAIDYYVCPTVSVHLCRFADMLYACTNEAHAFGGKLTLKPAEIYGNVYAEACEGIAVVKVC